MFPNILFTGRSVPYLLLLPYVYPIEYGHPCLLFDPPSPLVSHMNLLTPTFLQRFGAIPGLFATLSSLSCILMVRPFFLSLSVQFFATRLSDANIFFFSPSDMNYASLKRCIPFPPLSRVPYGSPPPCSFATSLAGKGSFFSKTLPRWFFPLSHHASLYFPLILPYLFPKSKLLFPPQMDPGCSKGYVRFPKFFLIPDLLNA